MGTKTAAVFVCVSLALSGCAGSSTSAITEGNGGNGGSGAGTGAGGDNTGGIDPTGGFGGGSTDCETNPELCVCTPGAEEACYDGPTETRGVGACTDGSKLCEDNGEFGMWGDCLGDILPIDEICDNTLDDDCDGETDEDCNCVPTTETCDGVDNDCDTLIDEDITWELCSPECTIKLCQNGAWTACGAAPTIYTDDFETAFAPQEGIVAPNVVSSWTVLAGDIDTNQAPSGLLVPSHTGNKCIDLNGWNPGTIETTVPTTVGQSYVLSFAYTKNPSPVVMVAPTADISIDGTVALPLTATQLTNSYSNLLWQCAAIPFTATASTTTLHIASTSSNPSNGGVFFDSFTIAQP